MNKNELNRSAFFSRIIFVLATALLFFLMALTFKHLEKVNSNNNWVNHSFEVSLKLEELYTKVQNLEWQRRNYLITGDAKHISNIPKTKTAILKDLSVLEEAIKNNPTHGTNLAQLKKYIHEEIKLVEKSTQDSYLASKLSLKDKLFEGNDLRKQLLGEVHDMLVLEKKLLNERQSSLSLSQKNTPIYLYILSIFALGLLAYVFYKTYKDVNSQIKIIQDLQFSLDTSRLSEQVGEYGIWTFNIKTKKYFFSDNEYRILGYEPKSFEASYENFIKHIHPEDLDYVNQQSENILHNTSLTTFKYRVIRKDGILRHFQVAAKMMTLDNDEKIVIGITTDITEEIESQIKLEGINWVLEERNKNLSVANETYAEAEKIGKFGTWQWFIKDDYYKFSDNMIKLFGFDANNFEMNLKNLTPAIHPDDLDMVMKNYNNMREKKTVEPFVHRIIRHNDKALRYIFINSRMIKDDKNHYFLVIARDVTKEYLDKQTIEEKNITLEANNRELQAFNYAASHDLQEPLRKIETFISRLKDNDYDHFSDKGKNYLDRALVSAGRMRNLIDDLLQFSRSTRNDQPFEVIDFNEIMNNTLEELNEKIKQKKAEIITQTLPKMRVVPFQIQQLFINLIGNSIKYSKENVALKIKVSSQRVEAEVEPLIKRKRKKYYQKIVFEDNGIGFQQEYSGKIFTLFNRLHGREEYEGTGIGLAICKKIVENHNGYIYAYGKLDEGAKFIIFLPEY